MPGRLGRSLAEEMADLVDAPLAAGFQSLAAAHLMQLELPDEDALVCGDDEEVKRLALDLGGRLVAGRAIDAGPLADRALEAMTAVILSVNKRYRGHAGLRLTGLRDRAPTGRGPAEIREATISPLVAQAADLRDDDVVIAQKAVSKAEGRVVRLDELEPSPLAREIADDHDPRQVEAVLRESVQIVGAAAASSSPRRGTLRLRVGWWTPPTRGARLARAPSARPDASARRLRERFAELTGRTVGVVVTDSFGRPWRQGTTDVAIGAAGVPVLLDLRGQRDTAGYELRSTQIAVADEIAGAPSSSWARPPARPRSSCAASRCGAVAPRVISSCPRIETCSGSGSTLRGCARSRSWPRPPPFSPFRRRPTRPRPFRS